LHGFIYPTIMIEKLRLTATTKKYLFDVASFDWILFTSVNGVKFFLEALRDNKINLSVLDNVHIAAVGERTAEVLKKHHLFVHFIPSQFTTEILAKELKAVKGKKILLPRADIATSLLIKSLEKKGAIVVNMSIYQTKLISQTNRNFENLVKDKKIACITFTSPSTVKGFIKNIEKTNISASIFSLPVLAIGPVTTKSLQQNGFRTIYTADTFTEEGMLTKLQEIIL
jgi:uroporphyrinogen III methyltransferase/synthase